MEILTHKFVNFIPDTVEDGILYISMEFRTAIHRCVCGCGNEVVTPFSPTDWSLKFDGDTVSLNPSIGNWSFPCQSHYWITNNIIQNAEKWTTEQISQNKDIDSLKKKAYYNFEVTNQEIRLDTVSSIPNKSKHSLWTTIKRFLKFNI